MVFFISHFFKNTAAWAGDMTKSAKCLLYKHEDPQRKDRPPQWFSPYNPKATETDSWIGQPFQPLWKLQANERSPIQKGVVDSPWRTTQEVGIRPLYIHTYTNIHTHTHVHMHAWESSCIHLYMWAHTYIHKYEHCHAILFVMIKKASQRLFYSVIEVQVLLDTK